MSRLPSLLVLIGSVLISSECALAQHHVSGRVTSSEDGRPLPGANITVHGTPIGAAADGKGYFSLTVPSPDAIIRVSFVGYVTQEVEIGGRASLNIEMVPKVFLNEVVVVGYGTQERRDVTGAIVSLTKHEIQELPLIDFSGALQARAPGVVVLSGGNRPGEEVTVRIRGRRSLTASNDPLYVIDGIPVEGGLNTLNPRDIESMEVLKDASATAIYGSRGANGVVLVTTTRGGNQRTRVSYSGYAGPRQRLGIPDMMNADQYAEMKYEAARRNNQDPESVFSAEAKELMAQGVDTDWQDLVISTGYSMNHQLAVTGGSDRTRFYVSGNYLNERGIIKTQGFERWAVRVNLDHSISSRIRFGTYSQVSDSKQEWGSNLLEHALPMPPIALPYDDEGNLIAQPLNVVLLWNPLFDLQPGVLTDERKTLRIFGNFFVEADILDNLQYRLNFGPDLLDSQRGLFQGSMSTVRQGDTPRALKEHLRQATYTLDNILAYAARKDAHNFVITGLWSVQASRAEGSLLDAEDLPYETQEFHNLGSGATINEVGSNLSTWGLMSFMGRINYRLSEKYLVTLTGRWDGSSRLAEGNKWGFFPSVGLGWVLSEEGFMADQRLFSSLRLRASYGKTGNTGIDPYQTAGSLSRTTYVFGEQSGYGYAPEKLANPDLKWEVSTQLNLGVDFALFREKLLGGFDLYWTNTSDLLLERQLPPTSGFSSVLENIGKTKNHGWETWISWRTVSGSDFSWTNDLTLFGNTEKIVSLYGVDADGDGVEDDDPGSGWFIGHPLHVWYDYEQVGIWQNEEEAAAAAYNQIPGDIKVRDVNGDGLINQEDLVIQGSDLPDVTFGWTTRLRFKRIDFSMFWFGSQGHTINNTFRVNQSALGTRGNNLDVDYWTPSNPSNTDPRPSNLGSVPLYSSARGYESGSFIKLRNLQLGYTIPAVQWGIQYLRIYGSAASPVVFSGLDGSLDPEIYLTTDINNDGREDGGLIGSFNVPASKLWSFGIDLTF